MKLIFFFTLVFLFGSSLLLAQENKMYYRYAESKSDTYQLNIRSDNTFSITNRVEENAHAIDDKTYLEGSFRREGSDLILDNRYVRKDYRLRVINNEKILNINFPFIAQDTLYLFYKREYNTDGFSFFSGKWKNRKKDGLWRFVRVKDGNPIIEKEEIYKEGKLIKTTYPNK